MLFKKKSARRLAIREDVAEVESLVKKAPKGLPTTFIIASLFFVVTTLILLWPTDLIPYRVGDKAPTDLYSPVDFTITDLGRTELARKAARDNTRPILVANEKALEDVQHHLADLRQDVSTYPTLATLPGDLKSRWPGLTQEMLDWIRRTDPNDYIARVRSLVAKLPDVPIVKPDDAAAIAGHQADRVDLAPSNTPAAVAGAMPSAARDSVLNLAGPSPAAREELRRMVLKSFPHVAAGPLVGYLLRLEEPTYTYSEALTSLMQDRNADRVAPQGRFISHDTPIVKQGQAITEDQLFLLHQAQKEYEHSRIHRFYIAWWLSKLGTAMTAFIVTSAGALYVTRMHRNVNTAYRGWALAGLLLLTLFFAKATLTPALSQATYLLGTGPTLLTAIILCIAYNQRFALGLSSLHALLVTFALNQGLDFMLTTITGIAVFVFGLKEIRTRGRLIEVGVLAASALLVAVWAIGLSHFMGSVWNTALVPSTDLRNIAVNSLWAAAAGISVAFVALGLLPFIERLFNITTSMTLLELADTNKPLLRRLALEAPGTYNHSLTVGLLAEAAANAIGANGLLARVGAYYHDIGKLSKPQYFIENQQGGPNRHDKLSPAMSLLIIVGHVKDGIELAREYHLPPVVHGFIGQHHGTTLVEYFFHAARQKQSSDQPQITEAEFRYPGPKPQTKETAILMICDGVESITRSLPDHTHGRLESIAHNLVMKRLMDGQFSDCDLTLRDLSDIENALVRTLAGVYHGRVPYPKTTAAPKTHADADEPPKTLTLSQPA